MRQARCTQDQGDTERQQVHLVVEGLRGVARNLLAEPEPRFEERRTLTRLGGGLAQQPGQVELERRQDHQGHHERADHQQERLDDLDVGGALHATDHHVHDHQNADQDDRRDLGCVGAHAGERLTGLDTQQQRDQCAGADHLGQQIEDRHGDRGDGRRRADRLLLEPEGENVGHRVLARVAQQFRHQEQRHQPGDEEPDRVQEAVVTRQRDDAGDAEETRGRHVVTADRQAVLEAAERAATGIEVGGAPRLAAGPDRDPQRDTDKDHEQNDRDRTGGAGRAGCREELVHYAPPPFSTRARSLSASGSIFLSAYRAYTHAMTNVETNCSSPNTSATLMLPTIFVPMKSRA